MDARIRKFLEGRNISAETIKQMEEDKVDKYVLEASSSENLNRYLPSPGDQIAVKAFCKNLSPLKSAAHSERKSEILTSLRKKLLLKRRKSSESDDSDCEKPKTNRKHFLSVTGNKNALKNTRKIEIGWLNFENGAYVQVRTKRGGGTRQIDIAKDSTPNDILTAAKGLFFHNKISPLGSLDEFSFEVCDYCEVVLDPCSETVGEMYDRTKMNRLRFYMATKPSPRKEKCETETTDTETLPDLGFSLSSDLNNSDPEVFFNFNLMDSSTLGASTRPAATVTSGSSTNDSETISSSFHEGISILAQAAAAAGLQQTTSPHNQLDIPYSQNETPRNATMGGESSRTPFFEQRDETHPPTQSPTTPLTSELIIHRGSLSFSEMCGYFKDPSILKNTLNVVRVLPNGEKEIAEDTGGVMRDLLTDFWGEFYSRCTLGQAVKIPCLRHDFAKEEWTAVARILVFGWENAKYWPTALCKTFITHCIFPDEHVDSEELLADFMDFVSQGDKDIFQRALCNFDAVDFDDVLEAMEPHDCKTIVTATNFKPVLLEISHKELIQQPSFVSECWRQVISKIGMTSQKLGEVYASLIPNHKRVLGLLKFPESPPSETGKHLKKYVRELSDSQLRLFLRFCTGADMITQPEIKVEYVKMQPFARRPISHTCGCVLELADSYENFMEFRAEFDGVLNSKVWIMDIV